MRRAAGEVAARGESERRVAADPVNVPMVRHWVAAMGDRNPVYLDEAAARSCGHAGLVAPPAMAQVWTMPGLAGMRAADDPLAAMGKVLDDAGFTSIVATNCEQVYHRYLRPGERVSVSSRLGEVTGPKRTALGEGWFVTTHSTWYVGDEPVAEMMFRVLKFAPPPPAPAGGLRPVVSRDTEFFWAGTARGELRIQRCGSCRAVRHPPGPGCPRCGALKPEYVVSAGLGEVYSFVVHHHPPVPGRALPFVVALVELDEGVRVLAELTGVVPAAVRVGLPVRVSFERVDDELTLPVWRPR
ncbi:MAG TPA: bifunctional MaoC family dehydratase N-terminal/OB-fold nucleic acid binding domain-containing protein [Actinophytocola sp.]|uniref:bifunctional MaoC family dehydratase N-terminal/OB-fold nucleic acid binding domain-containing protein n=1 Tax=Actinophytocola sp. TaxID=1872138 RepID=UPI002DBD35EF|nr:bifunctional MaoC family dehydratase N-terminal/OB-fold nucleic acid binding domain-containing protein [Actinophytocola sp.]HEU5474165.1 bifunctional MaoC family dehydratase N-terminal/OB-fold nucleic acid binding domain-containing protein [Actinophytocola sp.]